MSDQHCLRCGYPGPGQPCSECGLSATRAACAASAVAQVKRCRTAIVLAFAAAAAACLVPFVLQPGPLSIACGLSFVALFLYGQTSAVLRVSRADVPLLGSAVPGLLAVAVALPAFAASVTFHEPAWTCVSSTAVSVWSLILWAAVGRAYGLWRVEPTQCSLLHAGAVALLPAVVCMAVLLGSDGLWTSASTLLWFLSFTLPMNEANRFASAVDQTPDDYSWATKPPA